MEPLYQQASLILAMIGGVWSVAWFISSQFKTTLDKVYTKIETLQKAILEKLEYHERHDDSRFESIRNSIWELRLNNTLNKHVQDQKDKDAQSGS